MKEILCSALIQPHFDRACATRYPDTSKKYTVSAISSFEDTFTGETGLEMQMQNFTVKKSFCIILMVVGMFSRINW